MTVDSPPSTHRQQRKAIALSSMLIVGLGLAGCAPGFVIDDAVSTPITTTEEPAPPSEPLGVLGTTHVSNFDVADTEGYTFHIQTLFNMTPYQSAITNAAPGFTDLVANVVTDSVQVTNTTPGRDASWRRTVSTWLLYPPSSRACAPELDVNVDNHGDTGRVAVVVEDGPNAGAAYCVGLRSPSHPALATEDSLLYDLKIMGVVESAAASLLAELNSPLAAVVVVQGGNSPTVYNQISGTCRLQLPATAVYGPTSQVVHDASGLVCG